MMAIRIPNTMRQITMADFQGWTTPPNSSPRRSTTVEPTMLREPSQSTALRPAQIGLLGVSSLRKRKIRTKTVPVIGTGGDFSLVYLLSQEGGTYD